MVGKKPALRKSTFQSGIAIVTGGTYLLTTSSDDWDLADAAVVTASGVVAGALIGTGVAGAAGAIQLSATLSSIALSGGTGALVAGEAYMIGNEMTNADFDTSDYSISVAGGALEGATSALIPGTGTVPLMARATNSGVMGTATYAAQQIANGNPIDPNQTGSAFGVAFAAGIVPDILSGGGNPSDPLILRNPTTSKDMAAGSRLNRDLNKLTIQRESAQMFRSAWRTAARNTIIEVMTPYVTPH